MIRVTTTLISYKFQKPFQASKHRIKGVAAKNLQAIKKITVGFYSIHNFHYGTRGTRAPVAILLYVR